MSIMSETQISAMTLGKEKTNTQVMRRLPLLLDFHLQED